MFEVAKTSYDPKGIVMVCLVDGVGEIVSCNVSSDDGVEHTEYRVLQEVYNEGVEITGDFVLYTTIEPDSERNPTTPEGVKLGDSVSHILNAGVKKVIYGVANSKVSKDIRDWFHGVGAEIELVKNPELIKEVA